MLKLFDSTMVRNSETLAANSLALKRTVEEFVYWDIFDNSKTETEVLQLTSLLNKKVCRAIRVLHQRENDVEEMGTHYTANTLLDLENEPALRRRYCAHAAMYARILYNEYRSDMRAKREADEFFDEISFKVGLHHHSDSSDSS